MAIPDSVPKKTDLLPRKEIPNAWAKSGHCPACQAAPLQAVHLSDAPDYLICGQCELSFEVEADGGKIRLKNVPEELGFLEGELRYHWIEPFILAEFLNNRLALIEEKARIAVPASLSDDEVSSRSISLYRLGNKPKMIEFILIQAGATPEQAHNAFVTLKEQSEQNARMQTRKFWLAGGIIFFLVFVLTVGWVLTPMLISAQVQGVLASPAGAVTQPSVLVQLLNNLPYGIRPMFLKSLPLEVKYNIGPASSQCPAWPSHAAGLFGGQADQWTRISQMNGWQMINTGISSTIRVPQGMYTAFVDNKTGRFSAINGPVTINNVNFIAILCH